MKELKVKFDSEKSNYSATPLTNPEAVSMHDSGIRSWKGGKLVVVEKKKKITKNQNDIKEENEQKQSKKWQKRRSPIPSEN